MGCSMLSQSSHNLGKTPSCGKSAGGLLSHFLEYISNDPGWCVMTLYSFPLQLGIRLEGVIVSMGWRMVVDPLNRISVP